MVILYQYANAVIFLCSHVSGQPSHATAPALISLEATRTIVLGRQPRSGLICFLCSLCSYVPAVSGKHKRYLLFLCPYVLMFSALAANTNDISSVLLFPALAANS